MHSSLKISWQLLLFKINYLIQPYNLIIIIRTPVSLSITWDTNTNPNTNKINTLFQNRHNILNITITIICHSSSMMTIIKWFNNNIIIISAINKFLQSIVWIIIQYLYLTEIKNCINFNSNNSNYRILQKEKMMFIWGFLNWPLDYNSIFLIQSNLINKILLAIMLMSNHNNNNNNNLNRNRTTTISFIQIIIWKKFKKKSSMISSHQEKELILQIIVIFKYQSNNNNNLILNKMAIHLSNSKNKKINNRPFKITIISIQVINKAKKL